jgi:hypothetical protein
MTILMRTVFGSWGSEDRPEAPICARKAVRSHDNLILSQTVVSAIRLEWGNEDFLGHGRPIVPTVPGARALVLRSMNYVGNT